MTDHKLSPAAPEVTTVYGACRPGYRSGETTGTAIDAWIRDVQQEGIERVCCLLDEKLHRYDDLLGHYERAFGPSNVCHAPIPDYQTVSERTLTQEILPFLKESVMTSSPVAVHCSAGMGRTGHVLALWLACSRDYSLDDAIETLRGMSRSPLEATDKTELEQLLRSCERIEG